MARLCVPVPRERLAILVIEAELCPHVLAHILGVVAATGAVAFSIHVRRGERVQTIELETEADRTGAWAIRHQLLRLTMVRHARWVERLSEAAPARAKL
ncbi:MAG TPA: hypothetical protein PKD48_03550 [Sphingopyxis sp.]|nr:hypothetical protein [Sphingopyxis sp.]